jgi:hypothetical protein
VKLCFTKVAQAWYAVVAAEREVAAAAAAVVNWSSLEAEFQKIVLIFCWIFIYFTF